MTTIIHVNEISTPSALYEISTLKFSSLLSYKEQLIEILILLINNTLYN